MIVIDNGKYEDVIQKCGSDLDQIRIPLSVDMFLEARKVFTKYPYALVTHNGGDIAVLCDDPSTYLHFYEYGGIIDTEFIDRYDVLFLHGCNELSVELIRRALGKWNGKTLVLVGEDWKYLVEELPDIEGVECIWQDDLLKEFYEDVTKDRNYLHVTKGMPAE